MAGITDFTAISHGAGNNERSGISRVICVENYISMTYVIFTMTYVMVRDR
jgi:hypothetical protein